MNTFWRRLRLAIGLMRGRRTMYGVTLVRGTVVGTIGVDNIEDCFFVGAPADGSAIYLHRSEDARGVAIAEAIADVRAWPGQGVALHLG